MWVFVLVDTSHTPPVGYMEVVTTQNAATLLPIIQTHVSPGTIVHSDDWSAYKRAHLPHVASHGTVNHSVTYVDPTIGIHTLEPSQIKV